MEGTELMARKKEPTPAENIAKAIIENYDPKSIKDVEDAVKSIFAPIFESMLQGEMVYHLGYETNDHSPKETTNRRNGYGKKTLKSSIGEIPIQTPRDRDGSFEPELVPKRTTDVSGIEQKVISMYAKGLCSQVRAAGELLTQGQNKLRFQNDRVCTVTVIGVHIHSIDVIFTCRRDMNDFSLHCFHKRGM